jgi:hemerythrin-like domain-containing protein
VALRRAVQRLQEDHLQMSALWDGLRVPLQRWSQPGSSGLVDAPTRAQAQKFCALYGPHIEAEEGLVYPAGRAQTDTEALERMGREMQRRRQAA